MSEIGATLVKELRDLTGAPMMDCKRALQEADGDLEEAQRLLREKGLAAAGKRAGRRGKEGRVETRTHDGRGAIVAVACETEPVAGNAEFLAFVQHVLDVVDLEGSEAAESLEEERLDLVARLGENIELRGARRVEAADGERLAEYVHPPARKIGVLVRARATAELARLLAMHVAAARPRYVSRDEVPPEDVRREREIYEKLPEVGSKPEHIRPQIVDGMIQKRFFAESVLLDQPWIHDPSLTVGRALAEHGGAVREFVRFDIAEGGE
ncbi:MAG: translation elongation factor Ts [Actinomycetota bacterium]|nr:translation elongation factor Ts [Actinomycetota bacterium]